MVSLAMAVQDQFGGTNSSLLLPDGNGIVSSSGSHNVSGLDMKDQFSCGDDYAPKARKPYTITKQRERWTEEEHKKFLEALKLYGRAWRKIEEHVGSKTAVQIRSHAQKFFTKVVRESSGGNTCPIEPIEIPPPRPKRKPVHPYPRKLVCPIVKEVPNTELSRRSLSPNLSVSEQENQSPTSVLSAVGSDTLGSSDSYTLNVILSPVSSVDPIHSAGINLTHPNYSPEENGTVSLGPVTGGSVPDEQSLVDVLKLGLFRQEYAKEVSLEEVSTRSLKLFGRTVLVTDSHRPSSPSAGTGKSFPSDMNEGKPLELLPLSSGNTKCSWSHLPDAAPAPGSLYCMQLPDKNSNLVEPPPCAPLPWWTFYGSISFPISPYQKQEPLKTHLGSGIQEFQDKEFQREESWTGSNSKSVNQDDNVDKNSDFETQSCRLLFDEEEREPDTVFELRPSEKSAFSVIKSSPEKCMKGFVPYKRRMSERETHSSTITGDNRAEQRIRLTSR